MIATITQLEDYIEGLKFAKSEYIKAIERTNEDIQKAEAQLDDLLRCEE